MWPIGTLPYLPEKPDIESYENRSVGSDSRIHKKTTTEIRVNAESIDPNRSLKDQFGIEPPIGTLSAFVFAGGRGFPCTPQQINEITRLLYDNTCLKHFGLDLFKPTTHLIDVAGALRSLWKLESLSIKLEFTATNIKKIAGFLLISANQLGICII